MNDLRRHIEESMADAEFRSAWQETELEYQVARQIVALRLKRGLSQKELARRVGTTQSTIARIENGSQNLSLRTINRLARALGATVRLDLQPHDGPQ
jgi:transcriptional regulator with XRE-family HTH domain